MVEQVENTKFIRNPIRTNLQDINCESFSSDIKLLPPPKVGEHNKDILSELLGL